ncbi:MAG: hypothetical protein M9894_08200 [Planctomycetes bacterium]|nr:hypothetical protein [Planctomycetota bacterium]
MSDDAQRERERRLRQGDDPADEARVLAGALRAGRLARERLALAAFLGHAAARQALGVPPGDACAAWVAALDEAGRLALVRAAVARLRAGWADVPSPRAALAQALAALEAWSACPCDGHAATLLMVEPQLAGLAGGGASPERAAFARAARDAARGAGALTGLTWGEDPLEPCLLALRDAGAPADPLVRWALGPGDP